MSESRTGQRFPLHLPIRVKTPITEHEGTTGDVSAAGVYIVADANLEIGAPLEFEIKIPAATIGAQHDVEIRCQGHVVRTGVGAGDPAHPGSAGVACVIDQYEIVRNS